MTLKLSWEGPGFRDPRRKARHCTPRPHLRLAVWILAVPAGPQSAQEASQGHWVWDSTEVLMLVLDASQADGPPASGTPPGPAVSSIHMAVRFKFLDRP